MSENPCRYFVEVDYPECVRRIRIGCDEVKMYYKNGSVESAFKPISWYEKKLKTSYPFFHEITEYEAAAILGGKPWEEQKP